MSVRLVMGICRLPDNNFLPIETDFVLLLLLLLGMNVDEVGVGIDRPHTVDRT
jgi:hypothetical protein